MFSSPLRSPRPKETAQPVPEISSLLASELGMEYASLRAPNGCPEGMYVMPSSETLLRWHGVFFVHRGPYAGSVLRFTLIFPGSYPQNGPTVRFDSDVFHPMVDPKTKIWHARGRLSRWQPRIDHVSHLLHNLKASFKTTALESVGEEEAVNKPVWSLYHHSHQTFLSMTSQRSLHSTSRSVIYPDSLPIPSTTLGTEPSSPKSGSNLNSTPSRTRKISTQSVSEEQGRRAIRFREVDEDERGRLWDGLKKSLGG